MNIIYIYRTLHPKAADNTFFSSAAGTFSRIDLMLGHKAGLSKFNKTESTSPFFHDHNAMRLPRKKTVQKAQRNGN